MAYVEAKRALTAIQSALEKLNNVRAMITFRKDDRDVEGVITHDFAGNTYFRAQGEPPRRITAKEIKNIAS